MIIVLLLLAIIGFAVSIYGYMVETNAARDEAYKPMCDISDRVSCTTLVTSTYGKFMGISLTIIGMLFYALMIIFAAFGFVTLILYSALAACLISLWLAYISYVKMRTVCLICTTVYIVNILLLVVSYTTR